MRIENINPDLWFEYANEVLKSWEEILLVKQRWLDNPNPTGEFIADTRVKLSIAKDNMNDHMRALVLCKGEWEGIIHTHREESLRTALKEFDGKVTAADSVYRGYDPYNSSLKVYNKLDNLVKICYAKLESVKDLTNALSAYTKDIYQQGSINNKFSDVSPIEANLPRHEEEKEIEETPFDQKYNKKILF